MSGVNQWLPIATAPRDGTEVLLYRPLAQKSGDPVVTIRKTVPMHRFCWSTTIPDGCDGQNFTEGSCYATHWMPLPEAPADTTPIPTRAAPGGTGGGL